MKEDGVDNRYRAAMRTVQPGVAASRTEKRLESVQARLVKHEREAEAARVERTELLLTLWEAGHTQGELAERLTRASERAGGPAVAESAVQKCLYRARVSA